jgi:hypothetical protein
MADLFVTHLAEEFHSLFRQDQRGFFTDAVAQAGLQEGAWRGTGFGTVLADFDLNGAPDLALVNGLVRRALPGQLPVKPGVSAWWARYAQRSQIFSNIGHGRCRDVSLDNPALCGQAVVGRSLAAGDLDNDGAIDLVLGDVGGPAVIYRNVAPRNGSWLRISLVDPACGERDAIGAEVLVAFGGQRRWGVLQPATSFLSNHDATLHFGLGDHAAFETIRVQWPDGTREEFPGGPGGRKIVLRKGATGRTGK